MRQLQQRGGLPVLLQRQQTPREQLASGLLVRLPVLLQRQQTQRPQQTGMLQMQQCDELPVLLQRQQNQRQQQTSMLQLAGSGGER